MFLRFSNLIKMKTVEKALVLTSLQSYHSLNIESKKLTSVTRQCLNNIDESMKLGYFSPQILLFVKFGWTQNSVLKQPFKPFYTIFYLHHHHHPHPHPAFSTGAPEWQERINRGKGNWIIFAACDRLLLASLSFAN